MQFKRIVMRAGFSILFRQARKKLTGVLVSASFDIVKMAVRGAAFFVRSFGG